MNTKSLEDVLLKNAKLCYLGDNDTACDVVRDLISVFYDLELGYKVSDLINKASKETWGDLDEK